MRLCVAMAARRLSSLLPRSLSATYASGSASLLSSLGDLFQNALLDAFSLFFSLDKYDDDDMFFSFFFFHVLMFLCKSDTISAKNPCRESLVILELFCVSSSCLLGK